MTTSRTEHGRAAQKEECRPFKHCLIHHRERGQTSNRRTSASLAIATRHGQMQHIHGVNDAEPGSRRRDPAPFNLESPGIDPQSRIFSDRSRSIRCAFPMGEVTPISTFLTLESLLHRPGEHRWTRNRFPGQLEPARIRPRRQREIPTPR